jgi:SLT domain-containing protein
LFGKDDAVVGGGAQYFKWQQLVDRLEQNSIPKEWTDKLMIKGNPSIKMLEVLKKIVVDKDATEQQRYKAQLLLDAGTFEKEIDMVDKKVEKKINDFIQSEIEKSVKRGTLPKGKKFRNLKKKIKNERL